MRQRSLRAYRARRDHPQGTQPEELVVNSASNAISAAGQLRVDDLAAKLAVGSELLAQEAARAASALQPDRASQRGLCGEMR